MPTYSFSEKRRRNSLVRPSLAPANPVAVLPRACVDHDLLDQHLDAGEPARCPVWSFHEVYSDEPTRAWAAAGCRSAGIGCLDCKQPVIDAIVRQQQPWRERAERYLSNPKQVHWILEVGTERARTVARETMRDVREAMGLVY